MLSGYIYLYLFANVVTMSTATGHPITLILYNITKRCWVNYCDMLTGFQIYSDYKIVLVKASKWFAGWLLVGGLGEWEHEMILQFYIFQGMCAKEEWAIVSTI